MKLLPSLTLTAIAAAVPSGVFASAPMKKFRNVNEILSVSIGNKKGEDIKNKEWGDIFVKFRYGSGGDEEIVRESQVLKKPVEFFSNIVGKALVSSDVIQFDDKPQRLFCRIIQRRRPKNVLIRYICGPNSGRERTLGTAEFQPKDLKLDNIERKVIRTSWKMPCGRSNPDMFVEIEVLKSRWRQIYTDANIITDEKLEPFFSLTSTFFKSTLEKTKNLRSFELPKPIAEADPDLKMESPLPSLENFCFPDNDEFDPVDSSTLTAFKLINNVPVVRDQLTYYRNRGEAIYEIRNTVGNNIATPKEGRWINPTRDSSMKRIFFSSIGMIYVKKLPGFEKGYAADLTDLATYPVRNGKQEYETYGSITYFDEHGNIVKITDVNGDVHTPGSEHWEWAKLKSRTGVFLKAAFAHFGEVHYMWGNHGGSTLRMFLSPCHPIRRAFTPHFYKTHHTCRRAQYSLFDRKGILSRGLSLKYDEGLKKVFVDFIGGFIYQSYPDELKEQDVLDCKFHVGATDGMDLHKIFSQYACDLFDEIYTHEEKFKADEELKRAHEYLVDELRIPKHLQEYTMDNVKEIWGEILFRVTGYHNMIGAVTAFALDPAMTNIRLQPKGRTMTEEMETIVAPKESAISVALISAITQIPCPTIGECWKQVLENPDCTSYATLRENLKKLEQKIDQRNLVRNDNVDFHPRYCAISISS